MSLRYWYFFLVISNVMIFFYKFRTQVSLQLIEKLAALIDSVDINDFFKHTCYSNINFFNENIMLEIEMLNIELYYLFLINLTIYIIQNFESY